MDIISVYHVVTERPMFVGQTIIFNDLHRNSVYNRVSVFQKIKQGQDIQSDLANLIKADMDKWGKVAYREMALEKVRKEEFPQYPSRMACLYTSNTLEEAQKWANFFHEAGRDVYSIVLLEVSGRAFTADACNCFDGVANEAENLPKARQYWKMNIKNERPVLETLVDGEIVVKEIVADYRK